MADEKIMVALQILCKCIASGNIDIIQNNQLTEEFFSGYEDEYNFIVSHYKEYGNVPDTATFISKFPDDDIIEVAESDNYLVDTIQEEYLYTKAVPVVQKIAKLLRTDANSAVEYMLHAVKELQPNYNLGGTDIIANGNIRYDEFKDRKANQDKWFFTTGFPELDDAIHGLQRVEEFLVILARTNQGKSWILEKICTHIWEIGFNVGYISPEMGPSNIGYRFDTLHSHIDNKGLMWGTDDVDDELYKKYIDNLAERKNQFIVATPADFDKKITVTKLKNWVKQYNLDAVAIDGITYLSDERGKRGDTKNDSLTNISEDLMSLSIEVGVPVLVVVQANRNGVIADKDSNDLPELESVRDSDGIVFNASKVIALRQNGDGDLLMQIKKGRGCRVGLKLAYKWAINVGEFINIPMNNDNRVTNEKRERKTERKANVKEDVF